MPGRGTPKLTVRVTPALVERFAAVAKPDMSSVLRAFIRWYLREPGARLPERPADR